MDIKIDIRSECSKKWQQYKDHINAKKFADITRKTLSVSGIKCSWHEVELSMLLSDDEAVKEYNARFRKVCSPTNVLSFPSFENSRGDQALLRQPSIYLGDIILSFSRIKAEALALGEGDDVFLEHTYYLFIHGVLHLLGYDHDDEKSQKEMEQLEASALKII